jgi:hypothetical protein
MKKIKLKDFEGAYNGALDTFALAQAHLLNFEEQPIVVEIEEHPTLRFEVEMNLDNEITNVDLFAISTNGDEIKIDTETDSIVRDFDLVNQEPLIELINALENLIQFEEDYDLECSLDYSTPGELLITFEDDFYSYEITIDKNNIKIEETALDEINNDEEENKRARLEEAREELSLLEQEISDLEEELDND